MASQPWLCPESGDPAKEKWGQNGSTCSTGYKTTRPWPCDSSVLLIPDHSGVVPCLSPGFCVCVPWMRLHGWWRQHPSVLHLSVGTGAVCGLCLLSTLILSARVMLMAPALSRATCLPSTYHTPATPANTRRTSPQQNSTTVPVSMHQTHPALRRSSR